MTKEIVMATNRFKCFIIQIPPFLFVLTKDRISLFPKVRTTFHKNYHLLYKLDIFVSYLTHNFNTIC